MTRDVRIVAMYLQGSTSKEIAPLVGLHPSSVARIVREAGATRRMGPRQGMASGGRTPRSPQEVWEVILARSGQEGECLVWKGPVINSGYGDLRWKGVRGTHRISYTIHHGDVPRGRHVMHSCDNPRCVNPSHLSVGSAKNNVDDCVAKERHARGEGQGLSRMTEEGVAVLRRRYAEGASQTQLASDYDISQATVSQIVRRITWKHIP